MRIILKACAACLCVLMLLAMCLSPIAVSADTFRDNFSAVSYSANNGNQSWQEPWVEIADDGLPGSADIQVFTAVGGGNYPGVRVANANKGVYRTVNLTGYTTAVRLNFTYRRVGLDDVNDYAAVEISNDDGVTWTQLVKYTGIANDASAKNSGNINIKNYVSAKTKIRFIGSPTLAANDYVFFDTVIITATDDVANLSAYYDFDEFSWVGAAGEVLDKSGNSKHATTIGGIANVSTISTGLRCYAGRFLGNTTDVSQYAVDTNIDLDSIGDRGHINFWYRSANLWVNGGDRTLLDASTSAPDNKQFYLILLNSGKLRLVLNDSAGGELSVITTAATARTAKSWTHIAVNWNLATGAEIFINGVAQSLTVDVNTLTSSTLSGLSTLYIGDNRSTYHPSGSANSARGDIDELRIYKRNRYAAQINTDRNATHACTIAPDPLNSLLAYYPMDESTWSSSSVIVDKSGNNKNASLVGFAAAPTLGIDSIAAGKICRAGSISFNSTNPLKYAIDTKIDVNNDIGSRGSINFWYQPLTGTTWANGGNRTLFDASKAAPDDKVFFLAFISGGGGGANNGKLRFSMRDSNGNELRVRTTSTYTPTPNNRWVHIAVNWDVFSDIVEIYLDGQKQALTVEATTIFDSQLGQLDSLYMGDNRSNFHPSGFANSARGNVDEMRIYSGMRTATQIIDDVNKNHACGPDHYKISHAGTGIACAPTNITITAHDVSDVPVDAGSQTIALSNNLNKGDWVDIVAGGGNLSNGALGDGSASYTFPANGTAVTLRFSNTNLATDPESINFDVIDSAGATEKKNILEDSSLALNQAGFIVVDSSVAGAVSPVTIPVQLSGKNSDTGYNTKSLYLRAVKSADNNPAICEPAFANASVNIDLGAEYISPVSNASSTQLKINTNSISTSNDNGGAGAASYTSQSLAFDVNGAAPIVLNYPDAGQIQLHARHILTLPGSPATSLTLMGSSNSFVVRPFGFYVDPADGDRSNLATSAIFQIAGETFPVTVKAVQWQSGDDNDNDGIPDGDVLATNLVTPNFNGTVNLSHTLVEPSSGSSGSLSGTTSLSAFSSGQKTVSDIAWSEVGIIDLIAKNNYQGTGEIESRAKNVGRFFPDHFTLTQGALTNRVVLGCNPASTFTYMGENLRQEFILTAENAATPAAPTTNYVGAFAKLDTNAELDLQFAHNGTDNLTNNLGFVMNTPLSWALGVANIDVNMSLNRPANDAAGLRGPYSTVAVAANPVDDDLVTINIAQDSDVTRDGTDDHWNISTDTTSLLYGRLELLPAYGPETRNLPMTIRAMFFNGANGWQVNSGINGDSCTLYSGLGVTLAGYTDNLQVGDTVEQFPAAPQPLAAGVSSQSSPFQLSASGAGNNGSVVVTLNGVASYLQYPWDTHCGGVGIPCGPQARASFGLYRGNDRVIYWREVVR